MDADDHFELSLWPMTLPPPRRRWPQQARAGAAPSATTSASCVSNRAAICFFISLVLSLATACSLFALHRMTLTAKDNMTTVLSEAKNAQPEEASSSSSSPVVTNVGGLPRLDRRNIVMPPTHKIWLYASNEDEREVVGEILSSVKHQRDDGQCPVLRYCLFLDLATTPEQEDTACEEQDERGPPQAWNTLLFFSHYDIVAKKEAASVFTCYRRRGWLQLEPISEESKEQDTAASEAAAHFSISYHPNGTLPLRRISVHPHERRHWRKQLHKASNRTRLAATFLNTCESPSRREAYLDEIQHYLPVQVYGKCGAPCPGKRLEDCLRYLSKFYKFFLVFEEHLCQFYHSGVLFSVLEHSSMVPVVFGGVDYTSLQLPESSFIEALGHSPRTLAHYLHHLDQNPGEYAQHLAWRENARVKSSEWPCDLCKMLQQETNSTGADYQTTATAPPTTNSTTPPKIKTHANTRAQQSGKAKCTSWPNLDFRP